MKKYLKYSIIPFFFLILCCQPAEVNKDLYIYYEVNPQKQDLRFFWQNENTKLSRFGNFKTLKNALETRNKKLVFAMNGGMFNPDFAPQGLYIENKIQLAELDTTKGNGNFYMQPNGIFYIDKNNKPFICETSAFLNLKKATKNIEQNIKYATQSGPMLISSGKMHKGFSRKSTNTNIRNGVGILPNGNLLFVMSKEKVNFHQFAHYFEQKGCKNALYLDGFVSKTYLPEKNANDLDGDFGVIIGVIE